MILERRFTFWLCVCLFDAIRNTKLSFFVAGRVLSRAVMVLFTRKGHSDRLFSGLHCLTIYSFVHFNDIFIELSIGTFIFGSWKQ